MDSKECEAFYDLKESVIKVIHNGRIKAVISEQGYFDPESCQCLDAAFWGFEPENDMQLWTVYVLTKAAPTKIKRLNDKFAKSWSVPTTPHQDTHCIIEVYVSRPKIAVKRKRPEEATIHEYSNISLQDQFHQEGQRVDKFNSIEDQKIVQHVSALQAGIMKQDPAKMDILRYQLQPFYRKQLFSEISRDGANAVFSVPDAQVTLREVTAGRNTNKIVNMLAKVGETSLVSVGDLYKERKYRLIGVQMRLSADDVLSKSSRDKFKQSKNAKSIS
ncbi:MAG: hypothetical protein EZS28_028913 [Streblomastix strix]|uniref:Uncharacterized protein n=1 Tax=Streblomastix strix TaxID=222440 RepID=A0A5J4UYI0_9EUKA|nr:MAG: hypothetical protein EZS28_028913 [Streblomastix strix]